MTHAMDAAANNVICMTTRFEAAPIFPIIPSQQDIWLESVGIKPKNIENKVYIYAIVLPDPVRPDDFTQKDIEVVDLHALQLQQTEGILKNNSKLNPGVVSQGLCGYEAFIKEVLPESIICAVECKRSDLRMATAGRQVFTSGNQYMRPFERDFQVAHEVNINSKYIEKTQEKLSSLALKKFKSAAEIGIQPTTNVDSAWVDSGLMLNQDQYIKESIFFHALRNGEVIEAMLSILISLQAMLKSIYLFFRKTSNYNDDYKNTEETINKSRTKPDKTRFFESVSKDNFYPNSDSELGVSTADLS